MQLWWDLVSPDGYGYPWGRTLGVVSYMDTLEIVASSPSTRRCAPRRCRPGQRLPAAWRWLHTTTTPSATCCRCSAGRGNYAYITRDGSGSRHVGSWARRAHDSLMRALAAERVTAFPARPDLPAVARFEWFRRGDRPAGVWLVRQGALRFALPITTGP